MMKALIELVKLTRLYSKKVFCNKFFANAFYFSSDCRNVFSWHDFVSPLIQISLLHPNHTTIAPQTRGV